MIWSLAQEKVKELESQVQKDQKRSQHQPISKVLKVLKTIPKIAVDTIELQNDNLLQQEKPTTSLVEWVLLASKQWQR
jgi:predicted phage-related endonuclease